MNPADRMGGHAMTDHYEKALDALMLVLKRTDRME